MAVNVANIITQARQAGIPDDQIVSTLQARGLLSSTGQPPQAPEGPQLHDTGSFLGNLANSAGNFASGLGHAIAHPIDTVTALGKVALGAVEEGFGGLTGQHVTDAQTQAYHATLDYFKQRYGSVDNFLKTAAQDPVGTASDASILFSGAGGILKSLAGDAGKVGTVADIANAASKAGDVLNPVNAVAKPLAAVADYTKAGLAKIQPALEQLNLRMPPALQAKVAPKLAAVTDFIGTHIPIGNPESRYAVATDIYNHMEDALQNTLQTESLANPAASVPKQDIINRLKTIPSQFQNDVAILPQVQRQIDNIVTSIEHSQPDTLPASLLNDTKRSFYKKAYDNLGSEIRSEVRAAIADVYKTAVEDTLKTTGTAIAIPDDLKPLFGGATEVPVDQFNQVYGTIITARKLLKVAQARPQIGFLGRLLSAIGGGFVGDVIGGPAGSIVGGAAGKTIAENVPATAIRSATGKAATRLSKVRIPHVPASTPAALNAASRAASQSRPTTPTQ